MATVCTKCKTRTCKGTCKTGVLSRVNGRLAGRAAKTPEIPKNIAVCSGKCKRTMKMSKMRRWKGDYYCPDCHADQTEATCSTCGKKRVVATMRRVSGRLICSWC